VILISLTSFKATTLKKAKVLRSEPEKVYNYDQAIETIKEYELYRAKPYELFGHKYIGYGHLIREGERYESLTEEQATELLKKDFNKGLSYVDKFARGAAKNKKLVLACYVYNCGIGSLLKSGLIKDISKYESTNFINGKKHVKLAERRKKELKLWKE